MHFLILFQLIISALTFGQVEMVDYETKNINDEVYEGMTYKEIFSVHDVRKDFGYRDNVFTGFSYSSGRDFYISLKVLEVYESESQYRLSAYYENGDTIDNDLIGFVNSGFSKGHEYSQIINMDHESGYFYRLLDKTGSIYPDSSYKGQWNMVDLSQFDNVPSQSEIDDMLQEYLDLKEEPYYNATLLPMEREDVVLLVMFGVLWLGVIKLVRRVVS